MTREDMYMLGCLFAVNRIIENGSSSYGIKVNGKWETVPWEEIKEWIEMQYAIEGSDTDKDGEMIDKIAKANANIEQLIDTVIFYEMKQMDGYCVSDQSNCEIDCTKCKERFFENKKIEMMERYLV